MKKLLLFFILFLVIISCNNAIVTEPDNLIDDDVMVDIFYDLSILDAARNSSYSNGTNSFIANDYILKKYKIDSLQFAQSNKYYATDVAKYKRMFKKVRDRLTDKKTEIEAAQQLKNAKAK